MVSYEACTSNLGTEYRASPPVYRFTTHTPIAAIFTFKFVSLHFAANCSKECENPIVQLYCRLFGCAHA